MEPFTVPSGDLCRGCFFTAASLSAAASAAGDNFGHDCKSSRPTPFFFRERALYGGARLWSVARRRRLVESDAVGMGAMGSGRAGAGRFPAVLLHDA